MRERSIQNDILRDLGAHPDVRLFRQNVGEAWAGILVSYRNGRVILDNARPFRAGLCVGSSDLIGLQRVLITPDMVGTTLAAFVAIEVKTQNGSVSTEQRAFIQMVNGFGGRGGIAHSIADAARILHMGSEQ